MMKRCQDCATSSWDLCLLETVLQDFAFLNDDSVFKSFQMLRLIHGLKNTRFNLFVQLTYFWHLQKHRELYSCSFIEIGAGPVHGTRNLSLWTNFLTPGTSEGYLRSRQLCRQLQLDKNSYKRISQVLAWVIVFIVYNWSTDDRSTDRPTDILFSWYMVSVLQPWLLRQN